MVVELARGRKGTTLRIVGPEATAAAAMAGAAIGSAALAAAVLSALAPSRIAKADTSPMAPCAVPSPTNGSSTARIQMAIARWPALSRNLTWKNRPWPWQGRPAWA